MRLPGTTTRRWMLVVAAVAGLCSTYVEVRRYIREARYEAARRAEANDRKLYDEGRIEAIEYLAATESLMGARLAVETTEAGRSATVASYLARVDHVHQSERQFFETVSCRGGYSKWAEVVLYVEAVRARYPGRL